MNLKIWRTSWRCNDAQTSVGQTQENPSIGRPMFGLVDNIKMDIQEIKYEIRRWI
jgi:hypothetical protein